MSYNDSGAYWNRYIFFNFRSYICSEYKKMKTVIFVMVALDEAKIII